MNVICAICSSEMVLASSEIFSAPCGHIFHHECLIQWLERSRSCPQCRERATLNTIHKIYFNFSNTDNIVEDPSFLQQRIDGLNFQIDLKNREIDTLKVAEKKLKKETLGLRQEVRKVETNIKSKDSAIFALKEQLKYFREENQEMNNCKTEIKALKKELGLFKNIQTLINASLPEVDAMVVKTHDVNTLAIYVSILKRELKINHERRTKLRDMYITLNQEKKQLQEELKLQSNICKELREENRQLNQKLMTACETLQNEELKEDNIEVLHDTTKPEEERDSEESKNIISESRKQDSDCVIISNDSDESSEKEKSQSMFLKSRPMKRSNNHLKVPTILTKKLKVSQPSQKTVSSNGMINFDGFGGHAKYDTFPSRTSSLIAEKNKEKAKMKQSKLNVGGNKKLDSAILLP